MSKPLVTVVMPSLNVGKYIDGCLHSVCQQTLADIEILCIDAGSTDGTLDVINDYASRDSRIRLIMSDKKSYGYQINLGIQNGSGEYLGIVETDDDIEPFMYEKLYEQAKRHQLDFVKANFNQFVDWANGERYCEKFSRLNDSVDYGRIIHLQERTDLWPKTGYNIWSAIYNMDFLRKHRIVLNESPGASYQDVGFSDIVTMMANNVMFLDDAVYNYRLDNAGSSVKSNEKYEDIPKEYIWLKAEMQRHGLIMAEHDGFYEFSKIRSYKWNYIRLNGEYREKFTKYLDEGIIKELRVENEMSIKAQENVAEFISLLRKKSVVLVSAGQYSKKAIAIAELIGLKNKIIGLADNDKIKQGQFMCGIRIYGVEEIANSHRGEVFVILNRRHGVEMKVQLENANVDENRIIMYDVFSSAFDVVELIKEQI